jgi:hypothetical protein
MRRLAPALVILALAVGCSKETNQDEPIDPSLHKATVEVKGMV